MLIRSSLKTTAPLLISVLNNSSNITRRGEIAWEISMFAFTPACGVATFTIGTQALMDDDEVSLADFTRHGTVLWIGKGVRQGRKYA